MNVEKLIEPALDWTGGRWLDRIDQAASLLFVHGYISAAQRSKITQKLEAQISHGIDAGRIVVSSNASRPDTQEVG